jgi:hypothetical protein
VKNLIPILLCFVFFSEGKLFSQNLVFNPSFEDTITCPEAISELSASNFWYSPSSSTPDYFNSCYVYGPPLFSNVDVPNNLFGFQNANFGVSYSGFGLFNDFQVIEYIGGTLSTNLDSGKNYTVEFYVSFADSANLSVDKIGLAFTSSQYFESTIGKLNLQPDIENISMLDNDSSWTKISGNYTAMGTEQYFIIGLFRDTSEISWDTVRFNPMGGYGAYYYVDDVSITEIIDTTDTVQPIDTTIFEINIFPNPNNGEFALNYNLNDFENGVFRIYNAIGQIVFEEKLIQNNGVRILQLNLSAGVYVWSVESHDAILKREKMIIVK